MIKLSILYSLQSSSLATAMASFCLFDGKALPIRWQKFAIVLAKTA
ncbi:hypothetical protein [uncultured Bacteroides sp.]|nr:hypothetical protein [uncultured Bacteroides sp.]